MSFIFKEKYEKEKDRECPPRHAGETRQGQYNISSEKRCFIAFIRERKSMQQNPDLINQHLGYYQSLWTEGSLLFAGSYVTDNNGMIMILAPSIQEAGEIIQKDPLCQAGYYGKIDIEEIDRLDMSIMERC